MTAGETARRTDRGSPRARRELAGLLGLAGVVLLATAWLHDDAFITFRTVDNVLAGFGPTWNVAERVQTYTHPLWLAVLLAGGATGLGLPAVAIGASLVASLLALWLVATRLAPDRPSALLAVGALLLSKAYVDYAASGLEDPLTRLLLVLFVVVRQRRDPGPPRAGRLALFGSAIALCRPDGLLVVLPLLVAELAGGRRGRAARAGALVLGLLPLLAWGLFAAFTYGSFVPNTALAKLGHGLPRAALVVQGLGYLLDSLVRDPATLLVIGAASVLVLRRRGGWPPLLLAGAWLHLGWVVRIGGDHMSGRFLGLALLAAVLAATGRAPTPDGLRKCAGPLLIAVVLVLAPRIANPFVQGHVGFFGVADERRGFHPFTGVVAGLLGGRWPDHPWRDAGEEARAAGPAVRVTGAVGMRGYYGGPEVHWVDVYALCDPLLARLPAPAPERPFNSPGRFSWRPGHLERPLPEGYLESLEADANLLRDPAEARLYDAIRAAVREGSFGDPQRLRAAWRLAVGSAAGEAPVAGAVRAR